MTFDPHELRLPQRVCNAQMFRRMRDAEYEAYRQVRAASSPELQAIFAAAEYLSRMMGSNRVSWQRPSRLKERSGWRNYSVPAPTVSRTSSASVISKNAAATRRASAIAFTLRVCQLSPRWVGIRTEKPHAPLAVFALPQVTRQ